MDIDRVDSPALFGTWKPAYRFEPGISSDEDDEELMSPFTTRAYYSDIPKRPPGPGPRYQQSGQRFMQRATYPRPLQRQGRQPYDKQSFKGGTAFKTLTRDSYWTPQGPKTEQRKVAGCSIELPVVAPATAPAEDRTLILVQTKNKLSETGTGEWSNKAQLLAQRFAAYVPNSLNETRIKLAKLKDWTSDVFSYGQTEPYKSDFTLTDLYDRNAARYLGLEIKVNAKNVITPAFNIPDLPQERSIMAYLKIPLNQDQTGIHQDYTADVMNTGETMMAKLKEKGHPVVLGRANKDYSFDTTTFDNAFKNIMGECEFQTIAAIIARDYIGKAIHSDINKRLRECRMIQWKNGKPEIKGIEAQHADFMRIVAEFPPDKPISTNLPNIAYHNLSSDLQLEMSTQGYEPPIISGTDDEQMNQLATFYQKALEAERKLKQTTSLIKRVSGRQQLNPASSFMANITTEGSWMTPAETFQGTNLEEQDPYEESWTPQQDYAHTVTMLSLAEKAMRKSSGEATPIECWGCRNLPQYEGKHFHRYALCPNRTDPQVREAAERYIRMHVRKRTSPYGPQRSASATNERTQEPRKVTFDTRPEQQNKTYLARTNNKSEEEADLLEEFGITQENKKLPRCNMIRIQEPINTSDRDLKAAPSAKCHDNTRRSGSTPQSAKISGKNKDKEPIDQGANTKDTILPVQQNTLANTPSPASRMVSEDQQLSSEANKQIREAASTLKDIKNNKAKEDFKASSEQSTHSRRQSNQPTLKENPIQYEKFNAKTRAGHPFGFTTANQGYDVNDDVTTSTRQMAIPEDIDSVSENSEFQGEIPNRNKKQISLQKEDTKSTKSRKNQKHFSQIIQAHNLKTVILRSTKSENTTSKMKFHIKCLMALEKQKNKDRLDQQVKYEKMYEEVLTDPMHPPKQDQTSDPVLHDQDNTTTNGKYSANNELLTALAHSKSQNKDKEDDLIHEDQFKELPEDELNLDDMPYLQIKEEEPTEWPLLKEEDTMKPTSPENTQENEPQDNFINEPQDNFINAFIETEQELTSEQIEELIYAARQQISTSDTFTMTGTDLQPGIECVIPVITDQEGTRAILTPYNQKGQVIAKLKDFIQKGMLGIRFSSIEDVDHFVDLLEQAGPLQEGESDEHWVHAGNMIMKYQVPYTISSQEQVDIEMEALRGQILMEMSTTIRLCTVIGQFGYHIPYNETLRPLHQFKYAYERAIFDAAARVKWEESIQAYEEDNKENLKNPPPPRRTADNYYSSWTEWGTAWDWPFSHQHAWYPYRPAQPTDIYCNGPCPLCQTHPAVATKPYWDHFQPPIPPPQPLDTVKQYDEQAPVLNESLDTPSIPGRPLKEDGNNDHKSLEIKDYPYFESLKAARQRISKYKTKDLTEYIIDRCIDIGLPQPTVDQAAHLARDAIEYDFASFDESKAHAALLKLDMERKDALNILQTFEAARQSGKVLSHWENVKPPTADNKIDWELRMIRESISRKDVELAASFAGEYKLSIKKIKLAAAFREWNRASKAKTYAEEKLGRKGIDLKSLEVILSNYQGYITKKKQEQEDKNTEQASTTHYCYYVPFSEEDMNPTKPNPPPEELDLEELVDRLEDQELVDRLEDQDDTLSDLSAWLAPIAAELETLRGLEIFDENTPWLYDDNSTASSTPTTPFEQVEWKTNIVQLPSLKNPQEGDDDSSSTSSDTTANSLPELIHRDFMDSSDDDSTISSNDSSIASIDDMEACTGHQGVKERSPLKDYDTPPKPIRLKKALYGHTGYVQRGRAYIPDLIDFSDMEKTAHDSLDGIIPDEGPVPLDNTCNSGINLPRHCHTHAFPITRRGTSTDPKEREVPPRVPRARPSDLQTRATNVNVTPLPPLPKRLPRPPIWQDVNGEEDKKPSANTTKFKAPLAPPTNNDKVLEDEDPIFKDKRNGKKDEEAENKEFEEHMEKILSNQERRDILKEFLIKKRADKANWHTLPTGLAWQRLRRPVLPVEARIARPGPLQYTTFVRLFAIVDTGSPHSFIIRKATRNTISRNPSYEEFGNDLTSRARNLWPEIRSQGISWQEQVDQVIYMDIALGHVKVPSYFGEDSTALEFGILNEVGEVNGPHLILGLDFIRKVNMKICCSQHPETLKTLWHFTASLYRGHQQTIMAQFPMSSDYTYPNNAFKQRKRKIKSASEGEEDFRISRRASRCNPVNPPTPSSPLIKAMSRYPLTQDEIEEHLDTPKASNKFEDSEEEAPPIECMSDQNYMDEDSASTRSLFQPLQFQKISKLGSEKEPITQAATAKDKQGHLHTAQCGHTDCAKRAAEEADQKANGISNNNPLVIESDNEETPTTFPRRTHTFMAFTHVTPSRIATTPRWPTIIIHDWNGPINNFDVQKFASAKLKYDTDFYAGSQKYCATSIRIAVKEKQFEEMLLKPVQAFSNSSRTINRKSPLEKSLIIRGGRWELQGEGIYRLEIYILSVSSTTISLNKNTKLADTLFGNPTPTEDTWTPPETIQDVDDDEIPVITEQADLRETTEPVTKTPAIMTPPCTITRFSDKAAKELMHRLHSPESRLNGITRRLASGIIRRTAKCSRKQAPEETRQPHFLHTKKHFSKNKPTKKCQCKSEQEPSVFMGVIMKSFKANPIPRNFRVSITERLPHIKLPIGQPDPDGNYKHNPTMSGIFDTGSGLTIGNLSYWTSVKNTYPDLVEDFGEMTNDENEQIRVGGIEQEGRGATCTHFIEMKTPFTNQGTAVTISIALTEDLSCNLIYGLPLIVKAKMTANLWDKFVYSKVFDTTFKIEYHPPFARETVVIQDEEIPALCAKSLTKQ